MFARPGRARRLASHAAVPSLPVNERGCGTRAGAHSPTADFRGRAALRTVLAVLRSLPGQLGALQGPANIEGLVASRGSGAPQAPAARKAVEVRTILEMPRGPESD